MRWMKLFGLLIVTLLGVASVLLGIQSGWLGTWWNATGYFSGPAVTLALGTSLLGGVVAAAAFEYLRTKADLRRWEAVAFEGASKLAADLTDLASEMRVAGGGQPIGQEGMASSEVTVLAREFVGARGHRNAAVASLAVRTADAAWEIVQAIPPLRSDPELVHAIFSARNGTRGWWAAIQQAERLNDDQASPEIMEDTLFVMRLGVDLTFQMLRTGLARCEIHQSKRIGRIADRQAREAEELIRTVIAGRTQTPDANNAP